MPSAKRQVQAAILTLNAVPRASRSTRPPNRPGGGPLQGTRAIAEILFPNPASVRAEGRGRTEQMAGERSVRPVRDAGAMKAEAVARVAAKTVMTRIEAISVECWYRGATTRRFRWEVLEHHFWITQLSTFTRIYIQAPQRVCATDLTAHSVPTRLLAAGSRWTAAA